MASATGFGRRTYRAFVPHPLAGWEPSLSGDALNALTAADRALAATAALPQTSLGGTLAEWMLTRDESIRSSVIEGVASTEPGLEWARYLDQAGRPVSDENDALTLGATKQIAAAVDLGLKMRTGHTATMEEILDIHRRLFAGTRDRDIGGGWRDQPIWIGPAGCLVEDASFVPPPAEHVSGLMSDLVGYLNTSSHPPVLRAAIVHAQFETIHPFEDGNGRTGRAIIHAVLVSAGLTNAAIPISTALSSDRSRYYGALNATRVMCAPDDSTARSAATHEWLSVFSDACEQASRQAEAVTRNVESMVARWQHAASFRSGSAAAKLLDALPSMPVLDAPMAAQRLGVTERAARGALTSLEAVGIVRRTGGQRNKRYTVPDVVGMLRQMTPDGGLPQHRIEPTRTSDPPVPAAPAHAACGHLGPRSGQRCALPAGHAGQHRYPSS